MARQGGFTLTEVIVVGALFVMVASFSYPSLINAIAGSQTRGLAKAVVKSLELCQSQAMNHEDIAECQLARESDGNMVATLLLDMDDDGSVDDVFYRNVIGDSVNHVLVNNSLVNPLPGTPLIYQFNSFGVPVSPVPALVFCSQRHAYSQAKFQINVPNAGAIIAEELSDASC